jgi:small subunit ribosomal protein S26e
MVDASSLRYLKENSAFTTLVVPKFYTKLEYCISCAIHARIVKVRSAKDCRNRDPLTRAPRPKDDDRKKAVAAPVAATLA